MHLSKKEYLQTKLNLSVEIIKEYLSSWSIILDKKIEQTVYLLECHGFSTTTSCEGHIPPYKKVDSFRSFWPYVQIELTNTTLFHLDEKKPRREIRAIDPMEMFTKLRDLTDEFNRTSHPFSEKNLEIDVLMTRDIGSVMTPLEVDHALKKHFGVEVLICDVGVQGILTIPQELLHHQFRKKFLKRTQHQMELFTKFLEWKYLNPDNIETDEK